MHPIPAQYGFGITSPIQLDLTGYKYEQVGLYHNYHFTSANYSWPTSPAPVATIIDGFSPNLNKKLHAGHLKNLAVAAALVNISGGKAVAMLGASLGVNDGALDEYKAWCQIAGYNPTIYFDTELPKPQVELTAGVGEYAGCKMLGDVVVYKSDGKSTYAAHDLSFAENIAPTHYLTGAEQMPHFKSLGLGNKHKPLGLVLGLDGKKMKSKTGDAFSAAELLEAVTDALKETPAPTQLAWNILAWQFNSTSVQSNTKFNLVEWAKSDSPGLYITYTYAKMLSALKKAGAAKAVDLTELDVELLGMASYFDYYLGKAQQAMEPSGIAHYALALAKKLANVYGQHSIQNGSLGFVYAVKTATTTLGKCMKLLGMYDLEVV